jgi:hypothetical protein
MCGRVGSQRTGAQPMITGPLAAPSAGAPFSDAVIAGGRLAFLAGQGPILNGDVVGGSIGEQAQVTLQNLAGCLDHWSSYRNPVTGRSRTRSRSNPQLHDASSPLPAA